MLNTFLLNLHMDKMINIALDLGKDITIGAGVFGSFFAQFDNYAFELLQVTDFNLEFSNAIDVWEALIRTVIGVFTIVGLYYRIKNLRKKHG